MAPVEIHSHAIESLRYIRDTMERATLVTAVPGRGGVVMGVTALAAALWASRAVSDTGWLSVWIAEGVLAVLIGVAAMIRKARSMGMPLWSAPARKFTLAFTPPVFVAAVLTAVLARANVFDILPGLWLCLYAVAVIGAGAFSVRIVPAMGAAFLFAGVITLFLPAVYRDVALAASFGGLHILFGLVIARRFGG